MFNGSEAGGIQQNFITTSKHNVYTASQKKVALSPYDDKRMEEPAAKKAKQRIVPSPVNTKTPPDPVAVMVKTHVTPEQAAFEEQLGRLSRQPIVRYNLLRLYSVCSERNQLSKNDLARLILKTPEVKEVPTYVIERLFRQFQLPNPPEESDYDSDETIAD
nr:unnamed protein product [Callosobruchus chinensis]